MADLDPRFDPRFNPAFQPGFSADPRRPPVASASAPSSPAMADSVVAVSVDSPRADSVRVDASPHASSLPPLIVVPAASAAPAVVSPRAEATSSTATTAAAATATGDPALRFLARVNRYVLVLAALSVAFVAAGLLILQFLANRMTLLATSGSGSSTDYYFFQADAVGANFLIVLGFGTATAIVFLFAARSLRVTQSPEQ